MDLPIIGHREEIIEAVRKNQVTIVVGETGSGKTTHIPIFLHEAGFARHGRIGVTEPRRIAAIATAQYVARRLNARRDGKVGFKIRFDDETSDATDVKFMTDGILLREIHRDRELYEYKVIMVDEAHERSVNIDFTMGLLKEIAANDPHFRIVIASATIDAERFSRYFNNAPIVNVSGRTYPVEIVWHPHDVREGEMSEEIARKVLEIHRHRELGDVLTFVSGDDEIRRVIGKLNGTEGLVLIPAHGALPPEEQQKIFDSYPGQRKVVVATNVAETSITIDGIVYVIDSGLIKQKHFNPETGIESLDVVWHSRAGCDQRAGRAGRTRPGVCFRLYTEQHYQGRPRFTEPEIKRVSLASVVLAMKDLGIEEPEQFDFLDAPNAQTFHEAHETLVALGAIERGKAGLTPLGKTMATLPLEPRISRTLLEAEKLGCVDRTSIVAAFFSAGRDVFWFPAGDEIERRKALAAHARLKIGRSDVETYLAIWDAYHAQEDRGAWCRENYLNGRVLRDISQIRDQLVSILLRRKIALSKVSDTMIVEKAVASGFAYNLLKREGGGYAYSSCFRETENEVFIHPGSALFKATTSRFVAAGEVVKTTKTYARRCIEVRPEWLLEIAPHLATLGEPVVTEYQRGSETAVIERVILFKERKRERGAWRKTDVPPERVGKIRETVPVAKAIEVQDAAIARAQHEGLVPLVFSKVLPSHSGYMHRSRYSSALSEMIATLDGIRYDADLLHTVTPGVTYYCRTRDSYALSSGRRYAEPVFAVWDFLPPHDTETPKS